jgi:sugar phosphate isomerase/epimerase
LSFAHKIAAVFMTVLASMSTDVGAAGGVTTPQLGVQLWSIRDELARDFEGTLKRLAAMGFQGVEFAGHFGPYEQHPANLKAVMEKYGLQCAGAHVPLEKLSAEIFAATVAFYQVIDCRYLIVPMDVRAFTASGALKVAAELNALQQQLTPLGMHTGYHNHQPEMVGTPGATPWDAIGANTSQNVILQQDVGWTIAAGKNPVSLVNAYPGRTLTTHYKAAVPGGSQQHAIIGQDSTDWNALLAANTTTGGTRWLVVEQEVYPQGMTPLQSVEASLHGLQQIIADRQRAGH